MARASHDPTARRPRGPEDAWVDGPAGRYWGTFGAAGLLLVHPDAGALLQLRAIWSHFGGTWALPGGARKAGETAAEAAIREADEEAGVPPELVDVVDVSVYDVGYWSYSTVIARSQRVFTPILGDAESEALRWVPVDEVADLPLHPTFAGGWPTLRSRLDELGF